MFLLILLAVFGARYFFNIYESRVNNLGVQTDTNTGGDGDMLPTDSDVISIATSTKWLDTKISYPKDNMTVKDEILKDYQSWADETKILSVTTDAKAKEMMMQDGMQYEYNASYVVASSSDYISYVYDIYTYTGGAHGGVSKKVFTFDKNGIAKTLNISDASIKKVLPAIRSEIKKQMAANANMSATDIDTKWINDGTEVKKENYGVYWYDGEDAVFYFGQYQVAPYVFGDFEIHIPIKSL